MNLSRMNLPRITLVLAFLVVWLITSLLILSFPAGDGDFLILFFGIPIFCSVAAMIAEVRLPPRAAVPVVCLLGLGMLGWALWLGLGDGAVFLVPALLVLLGAGLMARRRNLEAAQDAARRARKQQDDQ